MHEKEELEEPSSVVDKISAPDDITNAREETTSCLCPPSMDSVGGWILWWLGLDLNHIPILTSGCRVLMSMELILPVHGAADRLLQGRGNRKKARRKKREE